MRRIALGAALALFAVGSVACGGGGGGGSTAQTPGTPTGTQTNFVLTDAPSNELSVFQVEITGVSISPVGPGAAVSVFPQTANQTQVVNLLAIAGVNQLMGSVSLTPGSYDEIALSFINASAVDLNNNALTVLPQTSGTITMQLIPAAVIGASAATFQIDFDVNNSVSSLVTGVGGSLTLSPTVIATQQGATLPVRELKGAVATVSTSSMTMTARGGTFNVTISPTTTVFANNAANTGVADLSALLAANDNVEVHGLFTPATQTVAATSIEKRRAATGGVGAPANGQEVQGIVTAITGTGFDVFVSDSRTSGFGPGSNQGIAVSASTSWYYDRPATTATSANLALGQAVRVIGSSASALSAQAVVLRETKLRGTVASIDTQAQTAALTAVSSGRLSVSAITGFSNPVTLSFGAALPAWVVANATLEAEGQFNVNTAGVFTVLEAENESEANEAEIESSNYALASSSPLTITVTSAASVAYTVTLAPGATIVERNKNSRTVTVITAAALETGIAATAYSSIKAEGTLNGTTITATKIRADIGGDDGPGGGGMESELEGTTYSVTASSPLAFSLTGSGMLGGTPATGATISVTLSANAVITLRNDTTKVTSAITAAELATGLAAGTYDEVTAKGSYTTTSTSMVASEIKVRIR
jgi:hypothetical protein